MNDWQLENCIKMFISTFKRNYGTLDTHSVYEKYSPELADHEIEAVLNIMENRGLLEYYDKAYHLNVK